MTEKDWLRCINPREMLTHLGRDPVDRKYRLFVCACCRRYLDAFGWEEPLTAVESAERFADTGSKADLLPGHQIEYGRHFEEPTLYFIAEAIDIILQAGPVSPYFAASAAEQIIAAFEVGGSGFSADDELAIQSDALRDIIGNPFQPVVFDERWRTSTVAALAAGIHAEGAFDRLPILADALEDAGCTDADVLEHCRQPGEHVRGCWVVDLANGR